MFEIFGEFDSAEEINLTAAGLLEEGDIDNLKILAKENGLEEMAEVYIAGGTDELTDLFMAAVGKLNVEKESKEIKEHEKKYPHVPVEPFVDFLQSRADEEDIAKAIRKKGKNLLDCLNYYWEEGKKEMEKTKKHYIADMTAFLIVLDYYQKQ